MKTPQKDRGVDVAVPVDLAAALLGVSVATVYRRLGTPNLRDLTAATVRDAILRGRPKGRPRGRPFVRGGR